MTYIAYVIAILMLLFSNTQGLPFEEGVDRMLDNAVAVQGVMLWIAIAIWIGVVLLVGLHYRSLRKSGDTSATGCGALFAVVAVGYPLYQFVMVKLSMMLANSWGPHGATDPVRFWGVAALMFLFGIC